MTRSRDCAHDSPPDIDAELVAFDDRPGKFELKLKVKCGVCDRPLRFRGIRFGVSTSQPHTVDLKGEEACLPMEI